jgi:hypothetical protein
LTTSARRSLAWKAEGIPYVRGAQGTVVQIWTTDRAGNTVELQQDPSTATPESRPGP